MEPNRDFSFICPECGGRFMFSASKKPSIYIFCPLCGAKMEDETCEQTTDE